MTDANASSAHLQSGCEGFPDQADDSHTGASKSHQLGNAPQGMGNHGKPPSEDVCKTQASDLISCKDMEVLEKLGQGSFGRVYKCTLNGKTLALKIKTGGGATDTEVDILKILGLGGGHSGIVPLFSWRVRSRSNRTLLFFPCFPLDLKALILQQSSAGTHLEVLQVMRIASALCSAASFMHSRSVLHGDLKPRNILLRKGAPQPVAGRNLHCEHEVPVAASDSWLPVICDFGNSCHISKASKGLPTRRRCTLQYCAPEVLMPFMAYAWPSDVFSMGLVLAEVEHLAPVAMGSSFAQSNVEQLLILWGLCQPVAATKPMDSFACRVKRELAWCPARELAWYPARTVSLWDQARPTLGRVYGPAFALFLAKFLQLDPERRSSFHDLHERCCERLGNQNLFEEGQGLGAASGA
jgi:serine/threonine protein kinase